MLPEKVFHPAGYVEVLQLFDKVIINFKLEDIGYEEKMDLLTDGVCKGIFPISIIRTKEGITGVYSTSGYIRLCDCGQIGAGRILTVIEKTVMAMEECSRYMIFPDEFLIDMNTVYVKKNYDNIKFTYIPDKNNVGAAKKLFRFADELKALTTDNGRLYLEMFKDMMSTENINALKVRGFISLLKKEALHCNID